MDGKKLSSQEMEEIEGEATRVNSLQHTQDDKESWSAAIYKKIANEVLPNSVIMKEDTPGKHPHGLLPILDTKVCVKDGKIIFHHYAKPMASLEVVLFKSSMSMGAKLSILTQEACRRIRNFSLALPWSLKVKEINKLMWQMKEGGYSERTREVVARRTLGKVKMNMWNLKHLQKPL